MKKVELLNLKGEKVKDINLNEEIFGITPNNNVLNDAIILSFFFRSSHALSLVYPPDKATTLTTHS